MDHDQLSWNEYVAAMKSKEEDWPYQMIKMLVPDATAKKLTGLTR